MRANRNPWCPVGLEAPPSQRRLLHSEDPRPSVHLEHPEGVAAGRLGHDATPLGEFIVGQHEIRWSSDLHLVNVVRRRKLSRGERRCIVWAPAARSGTRSPSRPRNLSIFPGPRRLYSFRLDDVGHAVTGCTAVTTRTPAARGWPRLCQICALRASTSCTTLAWLSTTVVVRLRDGGRAAGWACTMDAACLRGTGLICDPGLIFCNGRG